MSRCLKDNSSENQQHHQREASYYPSRQIHHWPSRPACQWHRGGLPGESQVWFSVCRPHCGIRHCVWRPFRPSQMWDSWSSSCCSSKIDHLFLKPQTQQEEETSQWRTTRLRSRPILFNICVSDMAKGDCIQYSYADDTALGTEDHSFETIEKSPEKDLSMVAELFNRWPQDGYAKDWLHRLPPGKSMCQSRAENLAQWYKA